ncbi:DUF6209 family protein [Actinoplanes utahensis]|uniref:Uncharacterized protein n=1 Tax=Actinoplanes utahensis TaxID=1869 RepID=A0A0A6UHY0_ACTUT|nr:DUF6209 family protein [Actinoplanes utahensis]KHD75660.1 hypothetical protein MB27_21905 [Actinoplanes utahensis]GIF27203.1 hypothetical protein Aut01nite_01890 [Actinoplanes utahensis]
MHRDTGITPKRRAIAGIARILAVSAAALVALAAPAEAATITAPTAAAAATPTTTLRFAADGTDRLDGILEANRSVLVHYDPARLPACRNQYAGGDAWSIGVYYRIDGGPIRTEPVTRLDETRHNVAVPVRVDLPLGGRDLEMWFHAGDRTGCSEYDSRSGANYHYTIEQPAVATFGADWSESVTGPIRAGHGLVVAYDPARLPQCRETYNGAPAWHIDVLHRLDGGPVQSRTLTGSDGRAVPVTLDVTPGSGRVEMWFRVTGQRSGCTAYDSDFGANYAYAVA